MVEPPGPIPNPEVKRHSANGSETIGLVRVGRRQVNAPHMETCAGLFFCTDGSKNAASCDARDSVGGTKL